VCLRIFGALAHGTRQVALRIGETVEIEADHAQQVQCIEMPRVALNQAEATAFRLSMVVRVIRPRRRLH
jgi:hypothetical protein